jgi:excinuclease ABC subunit C
VSVPRPETSSIPDAPGAYLFRDADGRVVYVGKARSLRKRLASYWSKPLHPRTEAMMAAARTVEWIVASGEVDALMLEYNLIQEHRPRFNVRYRDDKSYPYLALTVGEEWPRAQVLRGTKRRKVRYFGPYGHAYAIRETLDAVTRVFPVRTCSNAFFDQRRRARRPCLYYDIGRCAGPCVPEVTGVTHESYRASVDALADFLAGNDRPVLQRLDGAMREAADRREYELAAKLRDQATAARRAMESQEMVLTQPEDLDLVGMVEDDLEAAFQVFFVRRGRVMGRKGWIVDRVEELDRAQLIASFLRELYMEREEVPPRVLVPQLPDEMDVLTEWLGSRREGRTTIAVPERGAKRRLLEVVTQNAREHFQRHKLRRASDFGARSRALSELSNVLGLEHPPLRIECYDISNLGPMDKVGSMVVFEDGLPKRSDYRRFEIKGVAGQDDFASMEEMLRRRFARLRSEADAEASRNGHVDETRAVAAAADARRARPAGDADADPSSPRRRRFAYPPSLIVVDGGRGQLSVAMRVLEDAGLHIPAVGLAKRLEEIYFPDRPDPLLIPRGSESLFVLQHLRDEAHRFAITYHREKRGRRALASPLDDIPGVGPTRKRALLKRFGSLAKLRHADAAQIAETPGIGPELAQTIHGRLHGVAAADRWVSA